MNLNNDSQIIDNFENINESDYKKCMRYTIQVLKKPKKLRTEYQLKILQITMEQIAFFKEIKEKKGEELYKGAVSNLGYEYLAPDQILFRAGEKGNKFYIVLSGKVGVYIKLPKSQKDQDQDRKRKNSDDNNFELKKIAEKVIGQGFGEIALIEEDSKRTATIISDKEGCDLAVMVKDDYKELLGQEAKMKLKKKVEYLQQYPFFKNWIVREIQTFSYNFKESSFKFNQIVYDIDEEADHMYFIKEGDFILQKKMDIPLDGSDHFRIQYHPFYYKKYCDICKLLANEFFGEEKIFRINKRIFRAVCISQTGLLYTISIEDIKKRIWDAQTKYLFINMIKPYWMMRLQRVIHINKVIAKKEIQKNPKLLELEKKVMNNPKSIEILKENQEIEEYNQMLKEIRRQDRQTEAAEKEYDFGYSSSVNSKHELQHLKLMKQNAVLQWERAKQQQILEEQRQKMSPRSWQLSGVQGTMFEEEAEVSNSLKIKSSSIQNLQLNLRRQLSSTPKLQINGFLPRPTFLTPTRDNAGCGGRNPEQSYENRQSLLQTSLSQILFRQQQIPLNHSIEITASQDKFCFSQDPKSSRRGHQPRSKSFISKQLSAAENAKVRLEGAEMDSREQSNLQIDSSKLIFQNQRLQNEAAQSEVNAYIMLQQQRLNQEPQKREINAGLSLKCVRPASRSTTSALQRRRERKLPLRQSTLEATKNAPGEKSASNIQSCFRVNTTSPSQRPGSKSHPYTLSYIKKHPNRISDEVSDVCDNLGKTYQTMINRNQSESQNRGYGKLRQLYLKEFNLEKEGLELYLIVGPRNQEEIKKKLKQIHLKPQREERLEHFINFKYQRQNTTPYKIKEERKSFKRANTVKKLRHTRNQTDSSNLSTVLSQNYHTQAIQMALQTLPSDVQASALQERDISESRLNTISDQNMQDHTFSDPEISLLKNIRIQNSQQQTTAKLDTRELSQDTFYTPSRTETTSQTLRNKFVKARLQENGSHTTTTNLLDHKVSHDHKTQMFNFSCSRSFLRRKQRQLLNQPGQMQQSKVKIQNIQLNTIN